MHNGITPPQSSVCRTKIYHIIKKLTTSLIVKQDYLVTFILKQGIFTKI